MPLLNYTTDVPAYRTIEQIQRILVKHGARAIMADYDGSGEVTALAFKVNSPSGELPIRLPIDVAATYKVLQRQYDDGQVDRRYSTFKHAKNVAWRIVKDWLEVQMALLETEMVKMEEIFLPYVITQGGRTIYQVMVEKRFLLGPGEGGKQ